MICLILKPPSIQLTSVSSLFSGLLDLTSGNCYENIVMRIKNENKEWNVVMRIKNELPLNFFTFKS